MAEIRGHAVKRHLKADTVPLSYWKQYRISTMIAGSLRLAFLVAANDQPAGGAEAVARHDEVCRCGRSAEHAAGEVELGAVARAIEAARPASLHRAELRLEIGHAPKMRAKPNCDEEFRP